MTSSRFAVATHILTLLALKGAEPLTSEVIAESVNTNPVVIRRTMAGLREAHLVVSQPGAGGGWRLVGAPEAITLAAVFHAVESEDLLALPTKSPNASCPVGRTICQTLGGVFHDAEAAMTARLACVTIADVLRDSVSAETLNRR